MQQGIFQALRKIASQGRTHCEALMPALVPAPNGEARSFRCAEPKAPRIADV
jgi:hypothetical protein